MKLQNVHLVWTEEKNFSFADLLSRSPTSTTQDGQRLQTVDILDSIKFFMTHNQQTSPIQCHYAVSRKDINTVTTETTVELLTRVSPIYLQKQR